MVTRKHLTLLLAAFISTIGVSCEKSAEAPATPGTPAESDLVPLTIEFDNIIGGQNLFLNAVTYTNGTGEAFTVSRFQYFISNISLVKTDGTRYTVPQDSSYFLIREHIPDSRYCRLRVPAGEYRELRFTVGVDSLRSTMDISRRTGVLDPAGSMDDGMYWGWNSGYIFMKLEGLSPTAPVDPSGQNKFRYHVGGFGGYSAPTINNIKPITFDLSVAGNARPRSGRNVNIHFVVDAMKVFDGPTPVSIAANPSVMFSDFSQTVANNYVQAFRHDHTEN
ncbi:MbnP family protein [Flaviaesturariibacter amylovorans]|uniref:Copper-binding protein MbnP-like domain-containing protein n=1 Tax=Flaviaesturariibacter amylovorans TaxID=1084520 RepID=A0ABP8HL66_9BACT